MKGWICMKVTAKSVSKQTANQTKIPSSNKTPKNKKPKDKKELALRDKLIVGGIIVVTILGFTIVKNVFFPEKETAPVVEKEDKPKEDTTQNETDKPEVPSGDVVEEAKQGLERPDEVLSADKVVEAKARLQEGLDYVAGLGLDDFIPTRCAAWQNTVPDKAFLVQQALELGYTMDVENSEWFNSDAEQKNVYQFIVKMHKDGEEDIVFSGNYLTGTRSINIAVMTGVLDLGSFASPGSGPQADDTGE